MDLVPFTLRHAFLLNLAENPLAVGGRRMPEDVKQAALICSQPATLGHYTVPRLSWWQRCKLEARTRTGGPEDLAAMLAYLQDYCSAPKLWRPEDGGGKSGGCHWVLSVVTGLMRELGYSREEAWQESPGAAQWYLASAAEQNPHASIRLWSEEDEAAMEALDEMEASA